MSMERDGSIARDDSLSSIGAACCHVEPTRRVQPFNLELRTSLLRFCQQTFIHEGDGGASFGTNDGAILACKGSREQKDGVLAPCKDRGRALKFVLHLRTKRLKLLVFLLPGAATAIFQQIEEVLGFVWRAWAYRLLLVEADKSRHPPSFPLPDPAFFEEFVGVWWIQ